MKVADLRNWTSLTKEEQARLRDVYQVDKNDNLPEHVTKTMAEPPRVSEEANNA